MKHCSWLFMSLACALLMTAVASAAETDQLIATIQQVGQRGEGHEQASAAVRELSESDPAALRDILVALDSAGPLSANWLRGAFEAVAQRALENDALPAETLEAYVLDRSHEPRARRMAYEWLLKADPSAEDRLIPEMLEDPSGEMRRDAVARLITAAEQFLEDGEDVKAKTTYRQALKGAVDDDQVKAIVKPLKELGETVDLQRHFGFVTNWHVIGPFDNTEMKGFDVSYPPEEEIDLSARYDGKEGEVRWEEYSTDDEYGTFDIAELTSPYKGAISYAATEFVSPDGREVEFRLGTANAWKLWLNGELLFAREEYHRGKQLDQYRVRGTLKPGRNVLLLKVCQNEQTESWAQDWDFQFRVCDFSGKAILPARSDSASREPREEGKPKS
ncbi:hypothetical protein Mal4_06010 [Maioricimonas rarisocia]|uniref:HEAT repeat protein n=1 Tax=Maioricimonas rarisocia TaxID=2528026 RepID=A0A517Z1F1_9PLAN|nr:hypothetical protein [Maioricimonas rarisocia]QDU36316.1 hypothetical protein Mal4_06010 [Maioricimonas rarisocia]